MKIAIGESADKMQSEIELANKQTTYKILSVNIAVYSASGLKFSFP